MNACAVVPAAWVKQAKAGLLLLALAGCGVVFTASAALVSSFQAGDGGWHLGTLAVAQLDSSPDLEIVIPYRDSTGAWYLDAFKYTGQRLPGFPYAAGGDVLNVSPTIYDLDHDGRDEIIFTRGNHVIALRANGTVLWSNTVSSANYVPNGGYQTVTNGFYWYPGGAHLTHLPSTAIFYSEVSSPIIADINGNGTNEIVTGWKIDPDPSGTAQDYNPFINDIYGFGEWGAIGEDWSGGVVTFDPATGKQNFVYHMHHLLEAGLSIGRPAQQKPFDIYALNDSGSVAAFDKTKPFGLWGKGMLHKQFGKEQRLMCGSYQVPIDVFTADLDGDGLDECFVAGTQLSSFWQPNETILDHDGAILWRRWLPHLDITHNFGWHNSSCLIPVNPDHDNHADVLGFNHSYEITFRYWNGVELVDRPGWPKNFYPYLPTPPVVGDVDGDGQEEIIIGTYNPSVTPSSGNLLIYALDGTLKTSVPVPGGLKHIPALADIEGRGRIDVIYRSLLGEVYVQNFGSASTNLVSWSTHRGNMRRDGNFGRSLYPPGTPLITQKISAFRRATFSWTNSSAAQCYRIFRADQPPGPFAQIATVTGATTNYNDFGLKPGSQYVYEVRAVYPTNTVPSVPFAILSFLNSNLVSNAGFEENDNSHWDKWYSNIDMTNMVVSTNVAFQGQRSMEIVLRNQTNGNSIGQFNQYGIPDSTIYVTPGTYYSYGGFFRSGGISQPSEHWLTWSSGKTGYDTNNRPALPWPYYYTPHFVAGTAPTDWQYVNRTFQLPAGFPNVELAHSFSMNAPGSGSIFIDNVFLRPIPPPSATNWATLVPFGSSWRYFTNTPATNWASATFNDSAWLLANAKFGAGSGPTNIVTRLAQHRPAYYFRKQFLAASSDLEELLLSCTCTDDSGAALYPLRLFINGTEINATIDTVTAQGNETRYFDLAPFASLIQQGVNTIAVMVGNYWSTWDDVAFDLSLKALVYQAAETKLDLRITAGLPSVSLNAPTGTIWQIQSCDNLASPVWQTMQIVTNLLPGVQLVTDIGQNGRIAPALAHSRYYRLLPY